jgi:hypothetical protein
MKINTPLSICSVLAAGMAVASADVVVQVNDSQAQGAQITWATSAVTYNSTKAGLRNNGTTAAGKAWIQFDLSSVWATYGEANLTSATFTIWDANGTSRRIDMAGLVDSSGLEGWTPAGLTWNNAPANNITSGYLFDTSLIYGGADLWQAVGGGVDVSDATYAQNATYTSPDISAFLLSDTDGKVTFMLSGSSANLNSSVFIGIPGSMPTDPALGSPTLTLTFATVPEPATLSLAMLGLGGLFLVRRRS